MCSLAERWETASLHHMSEYVQSMLMSGESSSRVLSEAMGTQRKVEDLHREAASLTGMGHEKEKWQAAEKIAVMGS